MATSSAVFTKNQGLVGPAAYSEEWYALRTLDPDSPDRHPPFVLGASVAGIVCGLSKYSTPLRLFHEIRGNVELREATENMLWGKRLESAVLDEFEERYGLQVDRIQRMYFHKEHPFIAATPDALYVDGDDLVSVDVKCTTSHMYKTHGAREADCFGPGEDEVPTDYVMQAQQQMLVTGAQRCEFPVLFDGNKLRLYCVPRDETLQNGLLIRLQQFYTSVISGVEPQVDWEHATTVELMKKLYGVDESIQMECPQEEVHWFQQLQLAKDDEATAVKLKEEAQAHLLHVMQEAHVMHIPEYGVALRRAQVEPTMWTEADVAEATKKLGTVKRRGYVRLTQRKEK